VSSLRRAQCLAHRRGAPPEESLAIRAGRWAEAPDTQSPADDRQLGRPDYRRRPARSIRRRQWRAHRLAHQPNDLVAIRVDRRTEAAVR
jgi:hypothetical protein